MCKPIKVGTPVDEGFKLMKDVRVDKTMVNGKAVFKTININKSASQDDVPLQHPQTNRLCHQKHWH
jgi:hypothetical protein